MVACGKGSPKRCEEESISGLRCGRNGSLLDSAVLVSDFSVANRSRRITLYFDTVQTTTSRRAPQRSGTRARWATHRVPVLSTPPHTRKRLRLSVAAASLPRRVQLRDRDFS